MFVGHYGPAAAVAGKRIKLWHGFIAVQFLDILWAPFILLGVEKMRVVEHYTAANHLDLYYMPYTHSLVMAVFWSVLAGGVYGMLRKSAGAVGGAMFGALVFSHWLCDLLMHKPDLELWFGGPKVGFGLWDYRLASIGTELGLFVVGMGLYLMRTRAKGIAGAISPIVLMALLIAAQIFGNYGPPPADAAEAAQSAILAYAIATVLAAFVDATRSVKG